MKVYDRLMMELSNQQYLTEVQYKQYLIENNLDPYRYLIWLMKTAKDADLSQEDVIQTLLPWNAPKECKAK